MRGTEFPSDKLPEIAPVGILVALTLKEQLAALPLLRSTTVLRVDLGLAELPPSSAQVQLEDAVAVVTKWWNRKAKPYDVEISPNRENLIFSRKGFAVDFARSENAMSLVMEEPDASIPARIWTCAYSIRPMEGRFAVGLRLSYQQPANQVHRPDPRSPRFLSDLVQGLAIKDIWALGPKSSFITANDVGILREFILSEHRTLPIIAVSADPQTGTTCSEPSVLAQALAGVGHVVQLDPEASWRLSREWSPEMSVYNGGIRCYNPGFTSNDNKMAHRLWLPLTIERFNAAQRNGFLNTCLSHVFTQVTAAFEAWPLLSPAQVRRDRKSVFVIPPVAIPADEVVVAFEAASSGPVEASVEAPIEMIVIEPVEAAQPSSVIDELRNQFKIQDEQMRTLEAELQLERAGRADAEKQRSEQEEMVALYREEVDSLTRERDLLSGRATAGVPEALAPLLQSMSGVFQASQTLVTHMRRMESDAAQTDELVIQVQELNATNINLRTRVDSLEHAQTCVGPQYPEGLRESIPMVAQKNPSLTASLQLIETMFSDRIVVLPSAYKSAEEASRFRHGEQAFDLLWKLANGYWETVQRKGDVEARSIFGASYAANEASTVSIAGQKRRTFSYKATEFLMDQHLRIGTADNKADTLRVHFAWVAEERKIIVGHCGKHLNF
jgi:hypothetical protein